MIPIKDNQSLRIFKYIFKMKKEHSTEKYLSSQTLIAYFPIELNRRN